MIVNTSGSTPSVTQNTSVVGKVLAVSGNGTTATGTTKVIVADNLSTPNQVYIYDSMSNTSVPLSITGATAADFSPDGLKAFIAAHDPNTGTNTLYIYSALEALKTVPLSGITNELFFHPTGAFGYLAGGAPTAITAYRTCDNALADTVTTPGTLDFNPFSERWFDHSGARSPQCGHRGVTLTAGANGCQPLASDSIPRSVNLGQGNFTPSQFILSADNYQGICD